MRYSKILVFLLCIITIKNHCAMDQQGPQGDDVVVINEGLLTELSAVIVQTECGWFSGRYIKDSSRETDTIINLIRYEKKLDPTSKGASPIALFCPIIFKEKNGYVSNLGQFKKKKHHEFIEAVRQNKALYCAMGQGIFIYSLEGQPNPDICMNLKNAVENAGKQSIELS